MRWAVTADEMRAMDRATIERLGVPGAVLMEHAGRAVAETTARMAPAGARVVVLCGAGNNGGDGYVAARWLRERGRDVRVYACAGMPRPGSDAARFAAIYGALASGSWRDPSQGKPAAPGPDDIVQGPPSDDDLSRADVIVDALLGTGLSKPLEGALARLVVAVNRAPGKRVAVDVPSGLDSDTGRALGAAVRADVTVTFGLAKIGLVTWPGCEHAGVVETIDIGIPRSAVDAVAPRAVLADDDWVRARLPPRPPGGHKGTHGHLLVVAGSPGKSGAALLTALGALRGGAGLVTLATGPETRAAAHARLPESMVAELDLERPPAEAAATATSLARGKDALACGPGIPTSPVAGAELRALVPTLELPMVLDADALNHLAHDPEALRHARAPVVLTPHPGEAARLLGVPTDVVQGDRVGAARRIAERTGAVVALKGARTIVAAPDGRVAINPTGNPALGTGGTGDVLCGLVGALLAQGAAAFDAAVAGVYLHGRAGDLCAAASGTRGVLAGEVADRIPAAYLSLAGPAVATD
jgi:NAD(P)H-hydrate epimerase